MDMNTMKLCLKLVFNNGRKPFTQFRYSSRKIINHHPLFKKYEIIPNVWRIEEKFFDSWNRANFYYIQGSTLDLLIDSGTGIHDLLAYLNYSGFIQDKRLRIIATHSHFDHSGGLHQFPKNDKFLISYHQSEKNFYSYKYLTGVWITNDEVSPKPQFWSPKNYRVKPIQANVTFIEEGSEINLGDRNFRVIHVPGHSPGSICLYDICNGILVSGDTVYQTDEELIDWYPKSNVREMYNSVQRLSKLPNVNLVLPGHNDPILSRHDFINHCEKYLDSFSRKRILNKSYSRFRTNLLLRLNATNINVPTWTRELMKS